MPVDGDGTAFIFHPPKYTPYFLIIQRQCVKLMEKKRLFVAVVIVWVVGTVTTYYLYSRGHLQKVSDVKIPLAMRFSSLRGLTDTPTTNVPVLADNPSTNVPQAGQQLTSAPTTAQPTPGRTKIGSQEQEQRLAMAERVELADDGSNIYISVLTTPGYHDSRLSRQYITWMQTVHPKQVREWNLVKWIC